MLDKTATTVTETRFLPALALAVSEGFPELGGRSLAVSNVDITKANVPTLPLVMVAFARSESNQAVRSSHPNEYSITDFVVVDFWLEPDQYRRADGTATPFWSYYPYEEIRDRLLTILWIADARGASGLSFFDHQRRSVRGDADVRFRGQVPVVPDSSAAR
jgi:hypothetical protein